MRSTAKFQYDPFISPHGPYDWTFVQKHIAANVNCIVGSGAAEHQEFVKSRKQQCKSVQQKHAVSIGLDGVTVLAAKSFQHAIANNYAHQARAFNEHNKAWMDYYFRVFRATGQSAKLAVSD